MPHQGAFFRSLELRHMHPDDALSGAGAAKIGGRFVPVGTRAIYASDSEETTFRELMARKDRLAGHAQFDFDRYPRITYRVDVKVAQCVDLRSVLDEPSSNELVRQCLDAANLQISRETGALLMRELVTDRHVSLYRKDELLALWRR